MQQFKPSERLDITPRSNRARFQIPEAGLAMNFLKICALLCGRNGRMAIFSFFLFHLLQLAGVATTGEPSTQHPAPAPAPLIPTSRRFRPQVSLLSHQIEPSWPPVRSLAIPCTMSGRSTSLGNRRQYPLYRWY